MTAFDQAWNVVKRYTPNWRSEAEKLLSADGADIRFGHDALSRFRPEMDAGANQEHPLWVGEGTKVAAYEHPHNSDYIVKVPYNDSTWSRRLFESRNENNEIMALLERLGYPIVGELDNWDRVDDAADAYSVQPRLAESLIDLQADSIHPSIAFSDYLMEMLPPADATLQHLINDRHWGNWGTDGSVGGIRNFDIDTVGFSDDWWPHENTGEQLQEHLNRFGIQHPVSRLLNIIPDLSHKDHWREGDNPLYRLQSFRNLLEEIEPHSDNPKNLTVDGRPIWLEGFE
tara:strand:- start:4534 stop:5391 length:858 start_codon:yes stop_codon:yes gene_type:complete